MTLEPHSSARSLAQQAVGAQRTNDATTPQPLHANPTPEPPAELAIKAATIKVVGKGDLTYDEAYTVMQEIMTGKTSPTQNAAFLAALSTKNARAETTEEIAGCAQAMRDAAQFIPTDFDACEIVGTGGDNAHSFNISTTSMFVMAAGGVRMAKHGNRAASSKSGAADCLEALGINVNTDADTCLKLIKDVGICFMFAQHFHPSMRFVGPIRKELGFRTVFNILGPLTNPMRPNHQILGVYDDYLLEPLAHVLASLGVRRGLVVFGQDKLDEISGSAPTSMCEVRDGQFFSYTITPEQMGLRRGTRGDLVGGTPAENAQITLNILQGAAGPKRSVVLLNAGAGLYLNGRAKSIQEGVHLAAQLIDTGAALEKLNELRAASPLKGSAA